MKDTFSHQSDVEFDQDLAADEDWVVIRRRNSPIDMSDVLPAQAPLDDIQMEEPAPDVDGQGDVDPMSAEAAIDADRISEPVASGSPDEGDLEDMAPAADPEPVPVEAKGSVEMPADHAPEKAAEPAEATLSLGARYALPVTTIPHRTGAHVWADLPRISIGAQVEGKLARRAVPSLIEYFRADPIAKGFDLLRTRLVRTIRAYGWRRIAVVAPGTQSGATFTAVNLALSLSRVPGSRTVLMDMNQRAPGVADALGVRNPGRLDSFLSAETPLEDYLVRVGDTLALGLADAPCDYAAEMLHDPLSGEVLDDMIETLDPDLVIYDMPPMLAYDDLAAFLPQVDAVLLVTDGTQTTPEHISACERILEGQSQLLGVVLNRARASADMDGVA
ncbi:exopolysaccharide biosynthesis protein [Aestuariivita sp.]|jgi:Mrp family chromosome partitioning ATPase|uniref:exopolysaccharide biosynthesis protein n=1 Tax=Aestuariivita sp. TaxID=1872407 RepID=UPI00216D3A97|nr:exopolysaccharide biosynthesis protein [Aestuariivita sp.]MCE8009680.1 CpsD/CapB family tyrosine-protein kinase [Aestuariivita sp.]